MQNCSSLCSNNNLLMKSINPKYLLNNYNFDQLKTENKATATRTTKQLKKNTNKTSLQVVQYNFLFDDIKKVNDSDLDLVRYCFQTLILFHKVGIQII